MAPVAMKTVAEIPVWKEVGATAAPPSGANHHARIVIVGAGPVGLALALDLGLKGHDVVVLNRLDFIAGGSKAICFSKRSLDIFDRLGVGQAIVDKGVAWNVGKVFRGAATKPVFQFDMMPTKDQKRPGFVNIQQYHVEDYLHDAVSALSNVDLRWGHEAAGIEQGDAGVRVAVATATGTYHIDADWVVACDGARSPIRAMLGLDFAGRRFEDNFLIADIRMKGDFPAERWFWFDPPFNPGQSALLHKQPDDIWRLDFQLGWNIDREACVRPENVEPYIRAMLGPDIAFTPEWYSVYTFQCRRMARFVHGRVLFAGDSAHLVSPFGARGCNGGLADIDNLGWKLDRVLRGAAPAALIESYNDEAVVAADENILNSSRSTDFMTPKSPIGRALRDAVLELASSEPFARAFVNSGRLSTAIHYPDSPLNTPDGDRWRGGVAPGSPALDAALGDQWLLDRLGGRFVLLARGWHGPTPKGCDLIDLAEDRAGPSPLHDRYDLDQGSAYLIRPDQYVAARWKAPGAAAIEQALHRAQGYRP